MNREKACVTAENTLRLLSVRGESLHEYGATVEGILYRRIKLDGSPQKGQAGLWRLLSPDEVLKHLITCEWQLTAAMWFKRHGITIEKLRAQRETERKKKLRETLRKR